MAGWLHKNKKNVTVRSGGHSFACFSTCNTTDCYVLNLSNLKTVAVDAEALTATVGAGVTMQELYDALWTPHKLAFAGGSTNTVGVAGLALGGGLGFLMRNHGLAADNVLAMKVALYNGTVVTASPTTHADLYWGLRGAGHANFGVVLEFTLRVVDASATFQYLHYTPAAGVTAAACFDAWQSRVLAPAFPREAYSQFSMGTYMANPTGYQILLVFNGSLADARALFADVPELAPPQCIDPASGGPPPPGVTCTDMSWADVYQLFGPVADGRALTAFSRFSFAPVAAATFAATAAAFGAVKEKGCTPIWGDVLIDAVGGAVADAPAAASAFPWRNARLSFQYNAFWLPSQSADNAASCRAWLHDVYEAGDADKKAFAPDAAYDNYPHVGDEFAQGKWEAKYYGDGWAKLQQLKKSYDPQCFLGNYAQAVRPPACEEELPFSAGRHHLRHASKSV